MTNAPRPTAPHLLTFIACLILPALPATAQMRGPTIVAVQGPAPGAGAVSTPGGPVSLPSRPTGGSDLFLAGPTTYAPRYGRPGDLPPRPFGFGYTDAFLPSGVLFVAIPTETDVATGVLSLRVTPSTAQVFVDGAFAGTAAEFATGRRLGVGPHRIELRADGYETHAFDKRILGNDVVEYRQDLFEVRPPAPRVVAPAPDTVAVRRPYYVIPGCYGGNTPPTASRLPAGCNITALQTREYMVRVPSS